MGGHRLTGPDGADFSRCRVAHREHEIEARRAGLGEFIPTLTSQVLRREMLFLEQFKSQRMDVVSRMTARTEAAKFATPNRGVVNRDLRHDGPRGVAGAEKQDVEWLCPPRDRAMTVV